MLAIDFYEDGRARPSSFHARGHVEIPESSSDEYSLVCAAASAILQAARLGLAEHLNLALIVEQKPGHLDVSWPALAREDERLNAVVQTARLALEQIARQYPAHLCVTIRREP